MEISTRAFSWFDHPIAAAVCCALHGATVGMRTLGLAMSSAHPLPLQAALLFALLARRRKAAQAKRGGLAAQVQATMCLMALRQRTVLLKFRGQLPTVIIWLELACTSSSGRRQNIASAAQHGAGQGHAEVHRLPRRLCRRVCGRGRGPGGAVRQQAVHMRC